MEAPKESPQLFITTRSKLKDGFDITSMGVVKIKNWYVRVSTTSLDSICVVMTHADYGLTNIAFFTDEIKAHQYITVIASDV